MFVEEDDLIFDFDEDIDNKNDPINKTEIIESIQKMPIDNIRSFYKSIKKKPQLKQKQITPHEPNKIVIGFFPYYVC